MENELSCIFVLVLRRKPVLVLVFDSIFNPIEYEYENHFIEYEYDVLRRLSRTRSTPRDHRLL
jgi:hypothetical protein